MPPSPLDSADESLDFSLRDILAIVQLQRKVIVGCFIVVLGLAAVYTALAERRYTAMAVVHLTPQAAKEIQTDGVQTDVTSIWNRNIDVSTKIAILESRALREKVLNRYQEVAPDDGASLAERGPGWVKKVMDVEARKGTELIDVMVTTPDPELSARLANIIAEVFEEEILAANTDALTNARKWLSDQLGEYEERIRAATVTLNEFERVNGLAGSTAQGETSLASRMASLNSAYGSLNTEVVIQERLVSEYERLLRAGRYQDIAKAMGSPTIEALTQNYAGALADRVHARAVYGEKMMERKLAEERVLLVEQELKSEVQKALSAERATLDLLRGKTSSVVGAIGDGKEQILELQTLWAEYEHLRTELANAKDFYQRLRIRMGEVELQSKTQFNRVRILEMATPPGRASFPIVPLNLGLGAFMGLVLGFGVAFLREWFDDTVGSPVDVVTYLKVPFLGAVPKVTEVEGDIEQTLISHRKPRSAIAEVARGVRTVLELNPDQPPKRLLVTSAVSSEGKTSTAVRLAIAYASAHRSVVLLDCDLRRPRVHKVFGGDRLLGVTNLIEGADVDSCVRPTGIHNFSYVSAGKAGDRPDELLSSPTLPGVLDELNAKFDIVIIDTPPTVLVADARILSRSVDGCVLVARENSTSRSLLREALSGLHQVGANVYGVVINAVDFGQRRTSYKYYGYGYRYTYEEDPQEATA